MTASLGLPQEESLKPVAPDIFAFAEDGVPHLLGGVCPACGRYAFPRADGCRDCGGELQPADLGRDGVIYSHTTIHMRPPYGLPRPYAVALIDLAAAPLRIFCLLDPARVGSYAIGQPVALSVAALGHDGQNQPCLRPFFTARS